jgi:hypothetical protein
MFGSSSTSAVDGNPIYPEPILSFANNDAHLIDPLADLPGIVNFS